MLSEGLWPKGSSRPVGRPGRQPALALRRPPTARPPEIRLPQERASPDRRVRAIEGLGTLSPSVPPDQAAHSPATLLSLAGAQVPNAKNARLVGGFLELQKQPLAHPAHRPRPQPTNPAPALKHRPCRLIPLSPLPQPQARPRPINPAPAHRPIHCQQTPPQPAGPPTASRSEQVLLGGRRGSSWCRQ